MAHSTPQGGWSGAPGLFQKLTDWPALPAHCLSQDDGIGWLQARGGAVGLAVGRAPEPDALDEITARAGEALNRAREQAPEVLAQAQQAGTRAALEAAAQAQKAAAQARSALADRKLRTGLMIGGAAVVLVGAVVLLAPVVSDGIDSYLAEREAAEMEELAAATEAERMAAEEESVARQAAALAEQLAQMAAAEEAAREAAEKEAAALEAAAAEEAATVAPPLADEPEVAALPPENAQPVARTVSGAATALDAGTLMVSGQVVWLDGVVGVDHPGAVAGFKAYLSGLGTVDCVLPDPAQQVGACTTPTGVDVAETAVLSGMATAAPDAPDHIRAAEQQARQNRAGIWSMR